MNKDPFDFYLQFLGSPTSAEAGASSAPALDAEAELLDAYSQAVINVVGKVGPAVVNVRIKMKARGRTPAYQEAVGAASGVIITPDGYIVTNSHVVAGAHALK